MSYEQLIEEVERLVQERLALARKAPESSCRTCAVEELEEVLAIIQEVRDIYF